MSTRAEGGTSLPPTALRLTFSYENDNIYLVSQQRLELIASPSDALVGFASGQGSWIEVRTERDRVLYRQALSEAPRGDFEVFSPDPGQSITRVPVARQSGIFTVLVPDFAEAHYIALVSSAPGVERSPAELARFALGSDAEGGQA